MANGNDKEEVGRLFFELGKLLRQYMRKNFEDEGITMPQGAVISALKRGGEMMISELSHKLNLSNSTVSGIIDRMEKQQLVERVRSEEDRRIVYVKVSPKFDEMHKEAYKKMEKAFEELLNSGSPEEIAKIIDGLNALKKVLGECNKKECQ